MRRCFFKKTNGQIRKEAKRTASHPSSSESVSESSLSSSATAVARLPRPLPLPLAGSRRPPAADKERVTRSVALKETNNINLLVDASKSAPTVAPNHDGRVHAAGGDKVLVVAGKPDTRDVRRVARVLLKFGVLRGVGEVKELDHAKVVARGHHLLVERPTARVDVGHVRARRPDALHFLPKDRCPGRPLNWGRARGEGGGEREERGSK